MKLEARSSAKSGVRERLGEVEKRGKIEKRQLEEHESNGDTY